MGCLFGVFLCFFGGVGGCFLVLFCLGGCCFCVIVLVCFFFFFSLLFLSLLFSLYICKHTAALITCYFIPFDQMYALNWKTIFVLFLLFLEAIGSRCLILSLHFALSLSLSASLLGGGGAKGARPSSVGARGRHRNEGCQIKSQMGGGGQLGAHDVNGRDMLPSTNPSHSYATAWLWRPQSNRPACPVLNPALVFCLVFHALFPRLLLSLRTTK